MNDECDDQFKAMAISELAKLLKISRASIWRWMKDGIVPGIGERSGRKHLLSAETCAAVAAHAAKMRPLGQRGGSGCFRYIPDEVKADKAAKKLALADQREKRKRVRQLREKARALYAEARRIIQ